MSVALPDVGAAGAARVLARHVEESTGPKLDEANIVVSGGRGLGEAGNYHLIEELAKLLKGAPGASRAIVDAGLGAVLVPGGSDRQGREADGLRRRWHLGCHAAHGRA